jgi:hypothetical protein
MSDDDGFHRPAEKVSYCENVHMTPYAGDTHVGTVDRIFLSKRQIDRIVTGSGLVGVRAEVGKV